MRAGSSLASGLVASAALLLAACPCALAAPLGQLTGFSAGLQAANASNPNNIAAGPDGNLWFTDAGTPTPAIGRITPSGTITEFSTGLEASNGSVPFDIAAGSDGDLWFTDPGATRAIGRIGPSGTITEFPSGLQAGNGSFPSGVAAGPDGNMWFTDPGTTPAIGQIGVGVQPASAAAPSVTGSGQQGTPQVCQGDRWADWAGQQPLVHDYPFDGYRWLLDGTPIAGASSQSYTPTAGNIGHQLTCTVTVTYPLLQATTSATSAPVTVIPQASGPPGPQGQTGPPGPHGLTGPTGPQGKPGEVELVSCKTVATTVKHNHKKVHVTRHVCSTKLVSGPVKLTVAGGTERASLSRAGVVDATGYARHTRHGWQTWLLAARGLARGRYILTMTRGHGRLQLTIRLTVTIR